HPPARLAAPPAGSCLDSPPAGRKDGGPEPRGGGQPRAGPGGGAPPFEIVADGRRDGRRGIGTFHAAGSVQGLLSLYRTRPSQYNQRTDREQRVANIIGLGLDTTDIDRIADTIERYRARFLRPRFT